MNGIYNVKAGDKVKYIVNVTLNGSKLFGLKLGEIYLVQRTEEIEGKTYLYFSNSEINMYGYGLRYFKPAKKKIG